MESLALIMHKGLEEGLTNEQCMLSFRTTIFVSTYDLDEAFWQVRQDPEDQKSFSAVIEGARYRFTRMEFG